MSECQFPANRQVKATLQKVSHMDLEPISTFTVRLGRQIGKEYRHEMQLDFCWFHDSRLSGSRVIPMAAATITLTAAPCDIDIVQARGKNHSIN